MIHPLPSLQSQGVAPSPLPLGAANAGIPGKSFEQVKYTSSPLRLASDIAKLAFSLYVNSPYERNAELTQWALYSLHLSLF